MACVPWNENREEYLKSLSKLKKSNILVTHVGVSGGVVGKNNYPLQDAFTVKDIHPSTYDYVVMGHYHKPQIVTGTKNMIYAGAPVQHNFNDEGEERGFWVFSLKEDSLDFIPLEGPKFRTITEDTLGSIDVATTDYVRVQVTEASLHKAVKELQGLEQDIKLEIQKDYSDHTRSDIKMGMDYQEIIKIYAQDNSQIPEISLSVFHQALAMEAGK